MLPEMKSSKGVAMLLRSSVCYCVEVFEVGIFARVCVTVEICEGVSSQYRRVSERKLIIPPSAAFWLSWRSRYSVVLLFGVQLELMVSPSRPPLLTSRRRDLTGLDGPGRLAPGRSRNVGNQFSAGLS